MIRKLIPVVLLATLAACSSGTQRTGDTPTPSSQSAPSASASGSQMGAPSSSRQVCDSQRVQNMLGQTYSEAVAQSARNGSGSKSVRVLKPGQVMTMEYDEARLNIILNGSGAIEALRCG
ncbi:I78 family peptidase inhibitor [Bordetella genomosp. 13]|uniref:Peptidase inhibitor I78 family protein n=1 Tax=Bordetella genomosp. 13 TaxID=463040 RepID=A0A1W6ZAL3_9BORD|nr:I78 family peptidase inhibitor [Bordetella genomosp. 13]ARP94436.1 hypothetical protein CAL15_08575 [Bordetella genomosp. 13]